MKDFNPKWVVIVMICASVLILGAQYAFATPTTGEPAYCSESVWVGTPDKADAHIPCGVGCERVIEKALACTDKTEHCRWARRMAERCLPKGEFDL